ncbi:hypothetical protein EHQ76_09220 [Leptospira barantonii]|uniref:Uncharacterized protein n=1 Tax=Leptospira barantonii TaxID=2023184 RepID=A0A5F2BE28_9LEPT|nr:hypothetical protein [Leptospira barantonii]TGM03811.1 hypothetical protein EHQ76_09220 [Leptospira barantonii]
MAIINIIWIFTILVLSPTQLKLIAEKTELNAGKRVSLGRSEFLFSNTKEGDRLLSKKTKELRGKDDHEQCGIDVSESAGGYYYDQMYRDYPKDIDKTMIKGLNHSELADLCKKIHRL